MSKYLVCGYCHFFDGHCSKNCYICGQKLSYVDRSQIYKFDSGPNRYERTEEYEDYISMHEAARLYKMKNGLFSYHSYTNLSEEAKNRLYPPRKYYSISFWNGIEIVEFSIYDVDEVSEDQLLDFLNNCKKKEFIRKHKVNRNVFINIKEPEICQIIL